MQDLILLRGLPGSGKSTLAKVLANENDPVLSVDDYFTDEAGQYHFQSDKNHLAYKQCEQKCKEAMKNRAAKIFIHNTFTLDWEIEPYFKLAAENNYRVHIVTVENYHGNFNIHQVTPEQLKKMASKYKVKLI